MIIAIEAEDGNLGAAYNRAMEIDPDPFTTFIDQDVLLKTHNNARDIINVVKIKYPETALFSCYTNSSGLKYQVPQDSFSPSRINTIEGHQKLAKKLWEAHKFNAPIVNKPMSGYLMVINKEAWRQVDGFPDGFHNVDHEFCEKLIAANLPIRFIRGLYVYHLRDRSQGSWIEGFKTGKELWDQRKR